MLSKKKRNGEYCGIIISERLYVGQIRDFFSKIIDNFGPIHLYVR